MEISGIPRSKKTTRQVSKSDYKSHPTNLRKTLTETRVTKTCSYNVQFLSKIISYTKKKKIVIYTQDKKGNP